MCGIIGIVGEKTPETKTRAKNMMDALLHRGPDAGGMAEFNYCTLGHRRLSIIDLSTGAQPMYNLSKNIAVTFNGEIYGYKKIKEELLSYPFQTSSDTEVIIALYETYGNKFLEKLPGMFSFAIWDEKQNKLIAARDRFGEKPFYYAFGKNGEFIFASEIKAILASGLITPKISRDQIAHYLHRLYVHPTKTIYENIYTLPPAHMLTYENNKMVISRYWQMPKIQDNLTLQEALPRFKTLLTQAVTKQLVSDVPVGAFLSGGLDSTTIVSIASKIKNNLKTFSFGFEGTKNELIFAREAAKHYGTEHHELHDTDHDISELLLKMAEIYDEPFADSSNIPTYLISKKTREYATVVLTGDGGDELLAGYYGWYRSLFNMRDDDLNSFPGKVLFMRIISRIAIHTRYKNKAGLIAKARGLYYRYKYRTILDAHSTSNVFFKENELKRLLLEKSKIIKNIPSWLVTDTVDDAMRQDIEDYMAGDILVKIDRASMANSLELRAPFLDVDLAEFLISLPYRLKIDKKEEKIILRRAFENSWPQSIKQRTKQGFGAPVHLWLKKPRVKKLIEEYLDDSNKIIFKYISFNESRKYFTENDYKNYKVWIMLNLSIWLEKHKEYVTAND